MLAGTGSWGDFDFNKNKPDWWGREDIINSHKSRLTCKGQIDAYCAAIKKGLKIKSIDKWLKEKYGKTKNQLKWADCLKLKEFIDENNLVTLIPVNHYNQFDWILDVDIHPAKEYIWPTK